MTLLHGLPTLIPLFSIATHRGLALVLVLVLILDEPALVDSVASVGFLAIYFL
jgi:hypothetical protein